MDLHPLFFVRLCSRSSLHDGAALTTGSFLVLEGLFRWHLWDSGRHLALGRRQWCVTFRVCSWHGQECLQSSSERGGLAGTWWSPLRRSAEAGVPNHSLDWRKLIYLCVGRSGWTDTVVVAGESGSGGSRESWFTVEVTRDWNINVGMFRKVNTKQELHTVD